MRASQYRSVSAVLAAGLATTAQAATCYSGVNIFTARGTGEVPPTGLGIEGTHINAVLAAVPDSTATVVQYPANFGNSSVPAGVESSGKQIAEYLDACPTSKIVVMGYSQGAVVQALTLTGTDFSINSQGQAENYTVPALPEKYVDQIAAIVFFGDPGYNKDIGTNLDNPYPCPGSARTPRDPAVFAKFSDRLAEWSNYDDIFACATGTTFNGHVSYFSAENGTLTANFVVEKLGMDVAPSKSSLTTPGAPAGYATAYPTVPHPSTGVFVSVSQATNSLTRPSRPTASAGSHGSASRVSASAVSRASSISRGYASGTASAPVAYPTPTHSLTPSKGDAASMAKPFALLSWLAIPLFL